MSQTGNGNGRRPDPNGRLPKQDSESNFRGISPEDITSLASRGIRAWFDGTANTVVTVIGFIGIAIGLTLMLNTVTVTVDGVSASCGSVFLPTDDFTGNRATCGNFLSDRAVFGAAFLIGGVGFLLRAFAPAGICRVFGLAGICAAAAALTGLADELSIAEAGVAAAYVLTMAGFMFKRALDLRE